MFPSVSSQYVTLVVGLELNGRLEVLVINFSGWLAEIRADLWEAVAHLRHVCDNAL